MIIQAEFSGESPLLAAGGKRQSRIAWKHSA